MVTVAVHSHGQLAARLIVEADKPVRVQGDQALTDFTLALRDPASGQVVTFASDPQAWATALAVASLPEGISAVVETDTRAVAATSPVELVEEDLQAANPTEEPRDEEPVSEADRMLSAARERAERRAARERSTRSRIRPSTSMAPASERKVSLAVKLPRPGKRANGHRSAAPWLRLAVIYPLLAVLVYYLGVTYLHQTGATAKALGPLTGLILALLGTRKLGVSQNRLLAFALICAAVSYGACVGFDRADGAARVGRLTGQVERTADHEIKQSQPKKEHQTGSLKKAARRAKQRRHREGATRLAHKIPHIEK